MDTDGREETYHSQQPDQTGPKTQQAHHTQDEAQDSVHDQTLSSFIMPQSPRTTPVLATKRNLHTSSLPSGPPSFHVN